MIFHLTRVKASGFKGGDLDHKLSKLTFIHGGNMDGKTRVVQAVQLALCGKRPGGASQPHRIHQTLASNDTMFVEVCGDPNESQIRRTYIKGRKGISTTQTFFGVPDDWAAPETMFAPSGFLALSGRASASYLFRTLPPPAMDEFGPVAIVAKLKNVKLDPHTEAAEKAIDALCEFIRTDYGVAFSLGGAGMPLDAWLGTLVAFEGIDRKWKKEYLADADPEAPTTLQDWLAALAEQVRVKANRAKAACEVMEHTSQGNTELKSDTAKSMPSCEAALKAAVTALDAARDAHTKLVAQWEAKRDEIKATQAIADSYKEPEHPRSRYADIVANREAELAGPYPLEAQPIPGLAEAIAETEFAQAEAAKAQIEAKKLHVPHPAAKQGSEQAVTSCAKTEARLLQEGAVAKTKMATAKADRAKFDASTCCPTCRADGTGWKVRVLEQLDKDVVHLEAVVAGCEVELKANKGQQETAQAKLDGIIANEASFRDLQTTEKDANLKAERARSNASRLKQQRTDAIAAGRKAQETALEAALEALRGFDAVVAKAEPARLATAKLGAMRDELEQLVNAGKLAKDAKEAATRKWEAADTALAEARSEAAKAKTAAEAVKKAEEADAHWQVCKALAEQLAETVADCVRKSVAPLVASCNELCCGILRDKVAYEGGEFGLAKKTGFVPLSWDTISGAERTLTNAALGVALAAASGSEIKLAVVDELGNLDDRNKAKLLFELSVLLERGVIDQALVIDVRPPDFECMNEWHDKGLFAVVEVKA